MSQRCVITEIYRTPNEKSHSHHIWYHKNGMMKRQTWFSNKGSWHCDSFYDINGELHRDNDLPAFINEVGEMHYYHHGRRHRGIFKPAVIRPNGVYEYWVYGELRYETGVSSNAIKKYKKYKL